MVNVHANSIVARQKNRDGLMQFTREALQKQSDRSIEVNGEPPRQIEKSSHRLNRGMSIMQRRVILHIIQRMT